MPKAVTIKSLLEALAVIKVMRGQHCGWGEDCRAPGGRAV